MELTEEEWEGIKRWRKEQTTTLLSHIPTLAARNRAAYEWLLFGATEAEWEAHLKGGQKN